MEILELRGAEALPHLDAMARLRTEVFGEWPFLYRAEVDLERKYLRGYLESPRSFVVLALEDGQAVGMSTAIWLPDAEPAFREPFVVKGLDPATVCYYGESIVLRGRRGRGLGREFMRRRERFARAIPGVKWAGFTAIVRPTHHERRPADARVQDRFWIENGFLPIEGMTLPSMWKDLGETAETPKPMQFWLKYLGSERPVDLEP